MKIILLKFSDFKEFSNSRQKKRKKAPINKYLLLFYYPFALLFMFILCISFYMVLLSVKNQKSYSYRNSDKYRKVIKEGFFWDSIEYHQR